MPPNGSFSTLSAGLFRACFLLFSLMLFCSAAFSAIALDTTFSGDGKTTLEFPDSTSGYRAFGDRVFVQPGGRIVAVGSFYNFGPDGYAPGVVYAGLLSNGDLDGTYGSGGTNKDWDAFALTGLSDVFMYPDGRLLRSSQYITVTGSSNAKVVRANANGTNDGTFSASMNIGMTNTIPENVAARSDGKVVVFVFVQTNPETYHLFRLNSDGSRDTTFGVNGDKLMDFRRMPRPIITKMQVLPDNRILLAGHMEPFQNDFPEFFLARFNADGSPDKLFGRQGVLRSRFPGGFRGYMANMLVQPDGKILLVGFIKNTDTDTFLMRFTWRGKVDAFFGNAGTVISDFAPAQNDSASGAALSADGKIRIAGYAGTPLNFLFARYSAAGVLEDSTTTAFTAGQNSSASDVTIQADGKILLIGYTRNPNASINGDVFAIARYTE